MAESAASDSYVRDGYEIVRGFVEPDSARQAVALVDGLRAHIRRTRNIDDQRIQPLKRYLGDTRYAQLGALAGFDRLRKLLESRIGPGAEADSELLGLWIEPSRRTYVLPWHRDLRDNAKGLDWSEWYAHMASPRFFNQFHIALEPDDCLWVVPGSHLRDDTDVEKRMFPDRPIVVDFIENDLNPWYDKADKYPPRFGRRWALNQFDRIYFGRLGLPPYAAARRRNDAVYARALDYCRSMPGAVQVKLQAGDLMMYRNSVWHTAIYRADVRRTTLFSNASTPESLAWLAGQRKRMAEFGTNARWFSRDQLG